MGTEPTITDYRDLQGQILADDLAFRIVEFGLGFCSNAAVDVLRTSYVGLETRAYYARKKAPNVLLKLLNSKSNRTVA